MHFNHECLPFIHQCLDATHHNHYLDFSDAYTMGSKPKFETFLVEENFISLESIEKAMLLARKSNTSLVTYLLEHEILNETVLAKALAQYYGVPFLSGPFTVNRDLLSHFPAFTLRRYKVMPIEMVGQSVKILTSDPGNFLATDEIRKVSGLTVEVVCTTNSTISELFNSVQAENNEPINLGTTSQKRQTQAPAPVNSVSKQETLPPVSNVKLGEEHVSNTQGVLRPEISNAITQHLDQIILRCIQKNASDIHFEPHQPLSFIRERIDGVLYDVEQMNLAALTPMISRIKVLAMMDIVEKRLSQDGRFSFRSGAISAEIRASTLPTIHGEKVVLRLLKPEFSRPNFESLDIGEDRMSKIKSICELTDGLVLVAGPTGSGKTTTIYSLLSQLDRKQQNLITVEDPVEYELEMANQVQTNSKIGITFSSILPTILRQDPDIIMVGEIRDEKTAQMCLRAALSGHLVFSTIHAPSAIQIVTRLTDMGVPLYLIGASLKACISQRLLRRLCQYCKKPYEATRVEKSLLNVDESKPLTLFDAVGCERCHHIGYSGRFSVMEILEVTDHLRENILNRDLNRLEEFAKKTGFKTMRDHATERVLKGETTLKERVAQCP